MAELADALDLGSSGATRESSSLSVRTVFINNQGNHKLETKFNKLDETLFSFEVNFSKSEVDNKIQEELNNLQKNYQLEGFRKGKVPMNIIKQRFGNEVIYNICLDHTQDAFRKFIDDEKIELVSAPVLKDFKIDDDNVSAVLEFEQHPKIELIDFKELTVDQIVYAPEDNDIDYVLHKFALELGKKEDTNSIENYDVIVFGDFQSIDKETGNVLQNMPNNVLYLFSYDFPEAFKQHFLNKKVGDEFEIDFGEVDSLRQNEIFKVKINKIEKLLPKELTEEVISEISNGRFNSIEDLREDIALFMQESFEHYENVDFENNVYKKIIENYKDLPIPQSLLNESIKNAIEMHAKKNNLNPEELEKNEVFISQVKEEIRRQYIFEVISAEIIKKEQLTLEDDDIADYFESVGLPREMGTLDVLKNIDEKNRTNLINKLLTDKVMSYLKSVVTTNNVNADEKVKKMIVTNLSYYQAIAPSQHHHHHDHEHKHID